MADKVGRKPIVILSYSGVAVAFGVGPIVMKCFQDQLRANPYLLLGGNLFQIIGGGIPVLMPTLYSIAADVSSEEDK